MEIKERNEKYWDNGSKVYSELICDEINSFKKEAWKTLIKKYIGEDENKKVLDVGTGPGFFSIIMSEMGYDVTAIDSSEMMLKEAISNVKVAGVSVNFMKCDINTASFQKETFDLIVSRNVTWTLKEPMKVYKIWYELLKKNGKVLIFDANHNSRLINPKIQEKYENDQKLAKDMGYSVEIGEELEAEGDNISMELPLTYEFRPEWDRKVLLDIGFNNLIIDTDIGDTIHTEAEKIATRTTPMFSICGCK